MPDTKPELIECRACGHQISVKAKFCPNCGDRYSLKEKFDIWNKKRKQIYEKLEEERIRKLQQQRNQEGDEVKMPLWALFLYWIGLVSVLLLLVIMCSEFS